MSITLKTLQGKQKSAGLRVSFDENHSLEKEEERSLRGQSHRKIVKDIKKRLKMLSEQAPAAPTPAAAAAAVDKYTEEEKHARMKNALRCLKSYDASITMGEKCVSVEDFLQTFPGANAKNVSQDSLAHFHFSLHQFLHAAGAPEKTDMEGKLKWLKGKENMPYDEIMRSEVPEIISGHFVTPTVINILSCTMRQSPPPRTKGNYPV